MAEKSGSDETPLELRQKIARSRELVVRDMGGLRYELNFPLKFKRAFQRNTLVWVGAALAVGLCLALLRARPQKIYVNAAGKKVGSPNKKLLESGLLLGVLKLGLNLAQPIVAAYVKKRMGGNGPESRPGRYR
jgi:hypothetical protein